MRPYDQVEASKTNSEAHFETVIADSWNLIFGVSIGSGRISKVICMPPIQPLVVIRWFTSSWSVGPPKVASEENSTLKNHS